MAAARRGVEAEVMTAAWENARPVVVEHADHESARLALDWAADHAHRAGRPLVVWSDEDGAQAAVERGRERHPGLSATLEGGADLLERTTQAEMLVVGTSSRRLGPLDLESTRLVMRTACPVVVVPAHHPGMVRRGVLVGVPSGREVGPVLDLAYSYASLHDLPLTVLHATHDATDTSGEDRERWLAEALSGHAELFPDVRVDRVLVSGRPTPMLLQHSDLHHLLVVGRHTRVGMQDSLVGHVHSTMVGRAPCPVAVVPLPERGRHH